MFTGLIETIGQITSVETSNSGSRLTVAVADPSFLADARTGDSIAIDGVCTTVIALEDHHRFSIEASPETLAKTTFASYAAGKRVNLERPLTPQSRIGGHFVTGHADGTADILAKFEEGNSWVYRFRLNTPGLACFLIEKGSVAVNGISLTVNTVQNEAFTVAIIPHTLAHTSLGDYGIDDTVNIETDLLGKYVARLLQAAPLNTPGHNDTIRSRLFAGQWFCHDEAIHGDINPLIARWPEAQDIRP